MNDPVPHAPGPDADLSIGDLAERTGVSTATLRVWEARYGFPVPQRRASGHRRYTARDAVLVSEVLSRRDAGTRLDVAIEQALEAEAQAATSSHVTSTASVFTALRQSDPALMPQRLKKSTLLAMSWAIEDEFYGRAQRAHLFAAFQRERNYRAAGERWAEIARVAGSAFVFADFTATTAGDPNEIALAADAPMRREWSLICDNNAMPVALTAWELPGQARTPDNQRVFETVWTTKPATVRDAARVCASVAVDAGSDGADEAARDLAQPAPVASVADDHVTALFSRIIAYIDSPPH